MLFPAVKQGDMVIGVDAHTVLSFTPIPVPIPMVPHPYLGTIFLWMTPKFPTTNVLINGMPACAAGSMGYSAHIPMGFPAPPTMLNMLYWRRAFINIPKSLVLVALTLVANMAIAGITAIFVPPASASGKFIKDVTGIDTSSWSAAWGTIKGSFQAYTQWQTWVKLLIPPIPYPGAQGSAAIGSFNVTVNGGALAFAGPLMGASCTELAFVPNSNPMGFSNVMVGVTISEMIASMVKLGVSAAVTAGVNRAEKSLSGDGKQDCGCG